MLQQRCLCASFYPRLRNSTPPFVGVRVGDRTLCTETAQAKGDYDTASIMTHRNFRDFERRTLRFLHWLTPTPGADRKRFTHQTGGVCLVIQLNFECQLAIRLVPCDRQNSSATRGRLYPASPPLPPISTTACIS